MCRWLRLVPLSAITKAAILSAVTCQAWLLTRPKPIPDDPRRVVAAGEAAVHLAERPPASPSRKPTPSSPARAGRWLCWTAIVLLLPLTVAPWLERVLARKSNAANLSVLLGLTLGAGVAAGAMVDFRLDFAWSVFCWAAAAGMAWAYNWAVLAKLDSLQD